MAVTTCLCGTWSGDVGALLAIRLNKMPNLSEKGEKMSLVPSRRLIKNKNYVWGVIVCFFQYWCTDSRMVVRDPLCYGTAGILTVYWLTQEILLLQMLL